MRKDNFAIDRRLIILTIISLVLFEGSLYLSTLGRAPLAFIYVVIPLVPLVLFYSSKINYLSPIWSEYLVSRIKYILFIIQSVLLIFGPLLITDYIFSYIVIFLISLNIFLVALDQYKENNNFLYFIPCLYLMYSLRSVNMQSSATHLYLAQGMTMSFVIDYSAWFLMYPNIEKRFPILLHGILPIITFNHPEMWVVTRSFIGSILLFMTYNKYFYEYYFNTAESGVKIRNFQDIYKKIYIIIFCCRLIAEVM